MNVLLPGTLEDVSQDLVFWKHGEKREGWENSPGLRVPFPDQAFVFFFHTLSLKRPFSHSPTFAFFTLTFPPHHTTFPSISYKMVSSIVVYGGSGALGRAIVSTFIKKQWVRKCHVAF